MSRLREASLMEGKFFIEADQRLSSNGSSAAVASTTWEGKVEADGGSCGDASTKMLDDESDSDDDEEGTKNLAADRYLFRDDNDDDDESNSEKEAYQPRCRDSGIDSLLLETGTPGGEDDDDDEDDENQAFRPVVHSKRRRGSRGGSGDIRRPESWPSDPLSTSTPKIVASTASVLEKKKGDAECSENEVAHETAATGKPKKRKKKKNKKRTTTPVSGISSDDWDQLDLVDDDDDVIDDGVVVDDGKLTSMKMAMITTTTTDEEEASPKGQASSSSEIHAINNGREETTAGDGRPPPRGSSSPSSVDDKDSVFVVVGESRPGSLKNSLSESYDGKPGIKSILKNRSRTYSGESSCSDIFELPSSAGGGVAGDRRNGGVGGSFRGRHHSASLTSVTQSLESLSITSMLEEEEALGSGGGDNRDRDDEECDDNQQYCASWSSGGTRKSVHFSAIIDRKRFRAGAPPQNVGKGRRNSGGGGGKSGAKSPPTEHGKKRHLSEGDAGTTGVTATTARAGGSVGGEDVGCFHRKFERDGNLPPPLSSEGSGRADSPTTSDAVSVSSEDLFEMEELNGAEDDDASEVVEVSAVGDGRGSFMGGGGGGGDGGCIVASTAGTGTQCPTKTKKGKKNKSKKGKSKIVAVADYSGGFDEAEAVEGWLTVGNAKLGKKKSGSRNSSDLSLSDVDVDVDGHSIYVTDGASDFGAISIMDVGSCPPNGQKVSQ